MNATERFYVVGFTLSRGRTYTQAGLQTPGRHEYFPKAMLHLQRYKGNGTLSLELQDPEAIAHISELWLAACKDPEREGSRIELEVTLQPTQEVEKAPPAQATFLDQVREERAWQIATWGTALDDQHTDTDWIALITKYAGKAIHAARGSAHFTPDFLESLVKIAALAMAAYEAAERKGDSEER
jgi:hypothetical protein